MKLQKIFGIELFESSSHSDLVKFAEYMGAEGRKMYLAEYEKGLISQKEADMHVNLVEYSTMMFAAPHERTFYVTDKALKHIEAIKTDKMDLRMLGKQPDCMNVIITGKNSFFKYFYHKDFNMICATYIEKNIRTKPHSQKGFVEETLYYDYFNLYIDTKNNTSSYNHDLVFGENGYADKLYNLFLKSLIFIQFADIEVQLIPAGKKVGTKKQGYKNEHQLDVTIVDSKWNVTVVRTDGFDVSPHFRLQRCGKNYTDCKLIYIEKFRKHGYVRNARKGTI